MISIRVTGMEPLLRILTPGAAQKIQAASVALGNEVKRRMAVYPNLVKFGKGGRSLRWKSEKQRRYYVWMRRERGLSAEYKRQTDEMSQRLKLKWTVIKHGAVGAMVENSATYSPYVQGWKDQQPFHKDAGWVTDKQVAEQVRSDGTVHRIYNDALAKIVEGK